jgi:hypothetical protein
MLAAVVCSILATVAQAQITPVADVETGYSVVYVVKGFTYFMNGGSGAVALNVNNWLGAVADFGAYHAPSGVNSLTAETYTFGPRFSYRAFDRIVPFAQVLAGGVHSSSATTSFLGESNAFALSAGGGADISLDSGGRFVVRPQLEYMAFRANGSTIGNVRLSVGLVFRIGKKSRS